MKETKIYKSYIKLIETLKPMTWKQRLEHIWEYYKEYMFIAAMLILLLVMIISSVVNSQKEILISGILANVDMTETGWEYIDEDFQKLYGEDGKKQNVNISSAYFKNFNTSPDSFDTNYNTIMTAVSMAGAQTLDYLLMDQLAMEIYLTQDIMMDLTEFFTEEEIEEFGEKLIYLEITDENDETVSRYPVALNIEDMAFAQDCLDTSDGCYFALANNTPRIETCRDFWEYLLAWE